MSKTIIAPLVGFIAIIVNLVFHVQLEQATTDQIINVASQAVALVLVLDGIFRNHKK
jgi:hypothetical protein